MKLLALGPALLLGATAAHTQLLPVPNTRNPDREQTATELGQRPSRPDTLPAGRDHMPIADPGRRGATAMPNSRLSKSLSSSNGWYHYWDSTRQLAYEWRARLGSSAAPDSLVMVYQQATGATYIYRRRLSPTATPRLLSPGK
ncbi:MAG: hypothetical protein ACRYFK_05460 [Janthinobacterium lividum]